MAVDVFRKNTGPDGNRFDRARLVVRSFARVTFDRARYDDVVRVYHLFTVRRFDERARNDFETNPLGRRPPDITRNTKTTELFSKTYAQPNDDTRGPYIRPVIYANGSYLLYRSDTTQIGCHVRWLCRANTVAEITPSRVLLRVPRDEHPSAGQPRQTSITYILLFL